MRLDDNSKCRICIIGLGYVGLPLATEFGKVFDTLGFDVDASRIEDLLQGFDKTKEVSKAEILDAKKLKYTGDIKDISNRDVYIVTVPTPIDKDKKPNLAPLRAASETVGKSISKGVYVIFESTVYPGCTEEVCVPIIEKYSGLKFNIDFFVGYSPERINPGDKTHRLPDIKKVTSGSTPQTAEFVNDLYLRIITAGTHLASSIKVAEAAKVIENTQRDLNIALMNELAIIFNILGIDTQEVLQAAGSKWNFLPFTPGLVGGHCIGVDPYYLTHKSQEAGYNPDVILAGRNINDGMATFVASEVMKLMEDKELKIEGSKILILGGTFKENCPDIRNSRVPDIVSEMTKHGANIDIYDPWVNIDNGNEEFGVGSFIQEPQKNEYDAIILAVAHAEFVDMGVDRLKDYGKSDMVFYDVKSIFDKNKVDGRL